MPIANDYKYMRNTGPTPRFEEAFAFKHILNAEDSNTGFLKLANPLDKNGDRANLQYLITNTDHAYAQAMNRFNTQATTAQFETILEPTVVQPKPRVEDKSGLRTYYLDVTRGWKFERIDNNFAAPNFTKYEAVLRAEFSTPRVAKMSCMGQQGVVNHWDQAQNLNWFG
jgi:hypothetical protein